MAIVAAGIGAEGLAVTVSFQRFSDWWFGISMLFDPHNSESNSKVQQSQHL